MAHLGVGLPACDLGMTQYRFGRAGWVGHCTQHNWYTPTVGRLLHHPTGGKHKKLGSRGHDVAWLGPFPPNSVNALATCLVTGDILLAPGTTT